MNCRGCNSELKLTFLDLGLSPIANNLIEADKLNNINVTYPLHVKTCKNCALVQLSENLPRETIFPSNYTYSSSISALWLEHSKIFAEELVSFLDLNENDLVIEIASNDGYLLQFFKNLGIEVLGVEPALRVAKIAINKGIPTDIDFFGVDKAIKLANSKKPKLIIGNNVLAHVPDLHDFIEGISLLIEDEGIITFEFPHLLNLIKYNQFDTIYHEHYTYLSISALLPILNKHGLKLIDVKNISTHGGSLRIFVAKQNSKWSIQNAVEKVLYEESKFDPRNFTVCESLRTKVETVKNELVDALVKFKNEENVIVAYGAAAKGVTLINYCKLGYGIIDYVVDLNLYKQGKYLPGTTIPIVGLEALTSRPPDVVLVLPWNLSLEIKSQLSNYLKSGVKIIRAIPNLEYV